MRLPKQVHRQSSSLSEPSVGVVEVVGLAWVAAGAALCPRHPFSTRKTIISKITNTKVEDLIMERKYTIMLGV